jgi:16S rRNA (cytidine1402-2'-O)-methyltransferase
MPSNWPSDSPGSLAEKGCLYVVATPIGHRDDITLRALHILQSVDLVAAEDTRATGRLLALHGIHTALISYHEHNEAARTPALVDRLLAGSSVALVSEAGTPSVSDPGYRLVKEAAARQIRIIPIPGASAAMAALCAAGLPTDSFVFIGFAAKKAVRRRKQLESLAAAQDTLIFYESPKRILPFIKELMDILGDRKAVLAREMTKIHEEFLRGDLSELYHQLNARPDIKGECTLLVAGAESSPQVDWTLVQADLERQLAADRGRLADIAKSLARKYGLNKSQVYALALEVQKKVRSHA